MRKAEKRHGLHVIVLRSLKCPYHCQSTSTTMDVDTEERPVKLWILAIAFLPSLQALGALSVPRFQHLYRQIAPRRRIIP